jgi:hypothetical protein
VSLKLVKRPKSANWIMRGTVRGVRVEESTGTLDKRAAGEIRAKREAEILTESIYGRAATTTFAHAALSFVEEGGGRRFVAPVIDHFKTTPLRLIGQDAIDNAASKLYPKASNATRNRQVYTPVSAILQHAARKGWCPRPVFTRPKMAKVAIKWLRPEEAERLIAACKPHLQPLVISLVYTGGALEKCFGSSGRMSTSSGGTSPSLKQRMERHAAFPCIPALSPPWPPCLAARDRYFEPPLEHPTRGPRPETTWTPPQVPGSRQRSQEHAEGRLYPTSHLTDAGTPGPRGTIRQTAT